MSGFTLGVNKVNVTDTVLVNTHYDSFSAFIGGFQRCVYGKKDGSYFVRSSGSVRSNEGLDNVANVLVLDGDSRIDVETGEVVSGAPCPHTVSELLANLGINHCLYSSHSNREDLHKYRVLIECEYSREQLNETLNEIIFKLHDKGVMLHNVLENRVWSQPWFYPRSAQPENYVFLSYVDGGALFASNPTVSPRLANTPRKATKLVDGQKSPIDVFNEHWVSPTRYLESVGYQWRGKRMIRQGSNTDKAGVMVCNACKDGLERVYSVGGDTLNCGFALDAFDCFCLLECDGDFNKALKLASQSLKINGVSLSDYNKNVFAKSKQFKGLCCEVGESLAAMWLKQAFIKEGV